MIDPSDGVPQVITICVSCSINRIEDVRASDMFPVLTSGLMFADWQFRRQTGLASSLSLQLVLLLLAREVGITMILWRRLLVIKGCVPVPLASRVERRVEILLLTGHLIITNHAVGHRGVGHVERVHEGRILRALRVCFDSHGLGQSPSDLLLVQQAHRTWRARPVQLLPPVLRLDHLLSVTHIEILITGPLSRSTTIQTVEFVIRIIIVDNGVGVLLSHIRFLHLGRFWLSSLLGRPAIGVLSKALTLILMVYSAVLCH